MSEEMVLTKKDIPEEMRPSKWSVIITSVLIVPLCLFIILYKIITEGRNFELLFLFPLIYMGIINAHYSENMMIINFIKNHDKYMKGVREEDPLRYRYLLDKWSAIMMFCFLASFFLMSIITYQFYEDRDSIPDVPSVFFFGLSFQLARGFLRLRFFQSLPD